jgi:hypothetical protein
MQWGRSCPAAVVEGAVTAREPKGIILFDATRSSAREPLQTGGRDPDVRLAK